MAGGDGRRLEERHQFSVGMQVAGAQRHGAFAVADQSASRGADRSQPVGDVLWIADRGRQKQEFGL